MDHCKFIPVLLVLLVNACALSKVDQDADLNSALSLASAAESIYASRPDANPKIVAKFEQLLAVAQAAISAWENSSSPADQAAATAGIAALVAYQGTISN